MKLYIVVHLAEINNLFNNTEYDCMFNCFVSHFCRGTVILTCKIFFKSNKLTEQIKFLPHAKHSQIDLSLASSAAFQIITVKLLYIYFPPSTRTIWLVPDVFCQFYLVKK